MRAPALMYILQSISPALKPISIVVLFLALGPKVAFAEWHATGFLGGVSRIQAESLNLTGFKSGPSSTTTTALGLGGGRSLWKFTVDATFLRSSSGQTTTIVGPSKRFTETANGHAWFFDGGVAWPFRYIAKFRTSVRVGYGTAHVRVPTEIPIQDDRRFWTYGLVAARNVSSRYRLQLEVRSSQFRRGEIPTTLGRFNVAVLTGFGVRF